MTLSKFSISEHTAGWSYERCAVGAPEVAAVGEQPLAKLHVRIVRVQCPSN